jgi:integrase/recombinase XerD
MLSNTLNVVANELLLTQLINEITQVCREINVLELRTRFSNVLSLYEIKPIGSAPQFQSDLEDKIALFLASKQLEGLSKVTLDGYKIELRLFAKHIQKPIEQITTADIRAYLGQFPHLKLSSLTRRLSVLKSFFGWLTSEEIIQRDPTRKIKPPKTEKSLPKALTVEELEMLREACQTPRERALIEIFYATGCRLSEIHQLNRQDINWQTQSARVIGKGAKEREVFFSFRALFHLRKYLANRNDACSALFVTERKPYRRLSRRAIQREIKLIAQRAGIKKNVHPHTMRHTFATLTLNNGADLATIQALLGHANPATTQIYAQVSDERKREQYKRHFVM